MTETRDHEPVVPAPRSAADDAITERSALLAGVAACAARPTPVRSALQTAVDGVCAILGFPAAHAYLYDSTLGELVSAPIWHVSNPFRFSALQRLTAAMPLSPGVGLPGRVFATGRSVQLSVIQDDPGFRRSRVALTAGLRAAVGCPVVVHGQVVAVLEYFAPRHLPEDPELIAFLESVSAAVSTVFLSEVAGVRR